MRQTGTVSVWGQNGTLAFAAAGAIAAFPESTDEESTAKVEEFMNGFDELIGFKVSDERENVSFTVVSASAAGTGNKDLALAAMKFPPLPCKVTFTPDAAADSAAHDLYGAATWVGIYKGGAKRNRSRGMTTLQFSAFKPLSLPSGVTVDTLLTAGA